MKEQPPIKFIVVPAIVILTIFTYLTIKRNQVWNSNITLWEDVVSKSPNKIRPHLNLASAYNQNSELDKAALEDLKVLNLSSNIKSSNLLPPRTIYQVNGIDVTIKPVDIARNNLASYLIEKGNYELATRLIFDAVNSSPGYEAPLINLAVMHIRNGNIEVADKLLSTLRQSYFVKLNREYIQKVRESLK